jgi:hypothetical protein
MTCSHMASARVSCSPRPFRAANFWARVRYSDWISSAESSRPLARRTLRRQVMSWEISRMARMGFSRVRSRQTPLSSSSIRSTIEAVPIFR